MVFGIHMAPSLAFSFSSSLLVQDVGMMFVCALWLADIRGGADTCTRDSRHDDRGTIASAIYVAVDTAS
jgi:hypothetical protein